MVDFNSAETVSTPPADLLKVLILQRREYAIDCFEELYATTARGGSGRDYKLRAALGGLFLEIQAAMKRDLSEADYDLLAKRVRSDNGTDQASAFETMNEWLDKKQVTRVDNRRSIDPSDVEAENEAHSV